MSDEQAYRLGKKLGEKAEELTPEERAEAKRLRDWSRDQADSVPAAENHRVQKG